MNSNRNRRQKPFQAQDRDDRKKVEHMLRAQQREEQRRQERLRYMALEQRFNKDLDEKLQDYERLDKYCKDMEPIEQKQVQDYERTQQLELEQHNEDDDDYRKQLKEIELLEHEDEIIEKEQYHTIQIRLEQLELEQQSEQAKQELYYEWIQRSEEQRNENVSSFRIDVH